MRAKTTEREQAIALRKRGLSYSEILAHVPVSQASLSLWLRHIGLAPHHRQRLAARKVDGQRQAAQKVHQDRLARVSEIRRQALQEAENLLSRGDRLWLIGTILYWAEGAKVKPWRGKERVAFTNMDADMLRLVRQWLAESCSVRSSDLEYALYIHPDADVGRAREFWTDTLGIQPSELRVYFKRPNRFPRRRNTGRTYYGTIRMSVARSTALLHRIDQWIRCVAIHWGVG